MTIDQGPLTRAGIEERVTKFMSIHRYCRVEEESDVINSIQTDPSTADPKPVFRKWLHCVDHDASGPIEQTEGE